MHSSKILNTLAYFDVFNYPLKADEILAFSNISTDEFEKAMAILDDLVKAELISTSSEFYALENVEPKAAKRIKGNLKAIKQLKLAGKIAKLISYFPYVVGVGLSGSLSKNYADENSDIDFFIITRSNRLWICRTFLILFKKVFLLNSYKYFCLNYFVDENNLEIKEQNIYTAVEISTLLPLVNSSIFDAIKQENSWVKKYLPHAKYLAKSKCYQSSFIIPRLNSTILNKVDTWLMNNTIKYWQKKFSNFDQGRFELAFKASKQISTHHPGDFQFNILKQYELKREEALKKLDQTSVSF